MSVHRPDPERDAADVQEATERLISAAAGFSPADLAQPSLLPGWSRGHVLAHVSRNADSFVNLLTWARTDVETPQYTDEAQRDKEIEEGAGRPPAEHLDDLRASADRFARAVREVPPPAWASQVRLRGGKVIAAAEVPWRRLLEIRFHHIDLGIGYTFDDLPAEFVERELTGLIDDLSGHEGIAAVRLHDTGSGAAWDIGASAEPEVDVRGTPGALLAWLTRGTSEGLAVEPDRPLPILPPLGAS